MDTNPYLAAGTQEASTPSTTYTAHGDIMGGGEELRMELMEPYRALLRPLRRWIMKHHVVIHASEGSDELVEMPLKEPSIVTMVLMALLAPLVFLMLLPLILILVPLGLVAGFVALLISTIKIEETEVVQPLGPMSHQPA
ncbi:MAG: hypothetical protein V4662_12510 [Verrucomicrobiota bacterium]